MMTERDGDGAFYDGIADRADLGRRWPEILAGRPDFIKVYLLFSEAFATRRSDAKARGCRGLDPALLSSPTAHRSGPHRFGHVGCRCEGIHLHAAWWMGEAQAGSDEATATDGTAAMASTVSAGQK